MARRLLGLHDALPCVLICTIYFMLYSNGVGRSGTFCALLICINQFKQEQMVDVFQTVQIMRSQRPGLVENMVCVDSIQYIHTR